MMLRRLWFLFSVMLSGSVLALPEHLDQLPENTRVWENRSGEPGADYDEFQGPDIAFLNQEKGAWYYLAENGLWTKFAQGERLDLSNSASDLTEALSHEVLSGSPFYTMGSAADQQLILDGPSGELLTQSGFSFAPHNFELLQDSKGNRAFLDLATQTWWPASASFEAPLSGSLASPLRPLYLNQGLLPSREHFPDQQLADMVFEPGQLRYLNGSGEVVAFHALALGNHKEWSNRSNMPCSDYFDYQGSDVWYVNGVWYHEEQDYRWRPFHTGRYLSFSDTADHDFLEVALTNNSPVADGGGLADQSLRLDGETGQLVDASGQAINPEHYNSDSHQPRKCGSRYTLVLNDSLMVTGLAAEPEFIAHSRSFTLTDVVPLYQIENNPFNDRTVVLAVNQARAVVSSPVVLAPAPAPGPDPDPDPEPDPDPDPVPDPDPPPASGCPLDSPLVVIADLPESAPLANYIGIGFGNQLDAGFSVPLGSQALTINNPGNTSTGTVSVGANYTYVSGSALGSYAEGSNLTVKLRRNSDSAEFEINFSFQSDIVFDDPGIIITSLSGKQCTAGGPL